MKTEKGENFCLFFEIVGERKHEVTSSARQGYNNTFKARGHDTRKWKGKRKHAKLPLVYTEIGKDFDYAATPDRAAVDGQARFAA